MYDCSVKEIVGCFSTICKHILVKCQHSLNNFLFLFFWLKVLIINIYTNLPDIIFEIEFKFVMKFTWK